MLWRKFCLGLLALLIVQVAVAQSDDGAWDVVESQAITELLGETELHMPVLAPDGSAIAYDRRDEGVCIYRIAESETECYPWPEDVALSTSRANQPAWSPDGTRIAYTQNLFMFLEDSDIWTLNVETGEFTNHTEDGFDGSFFMEDFEDAPPLDYLPTWNPATGELYFFRSRKIATIGDSDGYSIELHKLGENGQSELVHDLTYFVPGPLAVYRPAAFSADGSRLALIAIPADWREDRWSGVWVLDLASGELEQVADMAAFEDGVPEGYGHPLVPDNVFWSGEDLVVIANDQGVSRSAPLSIPYLVDVEAAQAKPLVDYSDLESQEAIAERREEGLSEFSLMLQGVPTPDGQSFLAYLATPQTEEYGLYAFPLPPSAGSPELLERGAFTWLPGVEAEITTPIVAQNGLTLLYGRLFEIEREG